MIKTIITNNNGVVIKSPLTIDELWANREKAFNYIESTDSAYLIGCDYLSWSKFNKLLYHELKMIKMKDIVDSSESLNKKPIYLSLTTQAPPIDVSLRSDGKYRLYNGHRRYATAKAQKKKTIFAEIIHIVNDIQKVGATRSSRSR